MLISQEVLTEVREITVPYALDSIRLVSAKASVLSTKSKRSKKESIELLLSVDQMGKLHMYSLPSGTEIGNVGLEHNSTIVTSAFEGSDKIAYFVSTDKNGFVHVTCIEVLNGLIAEPFNN